MEIKTHTKTIAVTRALELVLVTALIAVGGLVLPLVHAHQLAIGTIVNAALIYSALRFNGKIKIALIICLPSVFALGLGVLGVQSVYALYMIPAIWLGNAALVLTLKFAPRHALTTPAAITAKVAIIFLAFNLLIITNLIPSPSPVAQTMVTMFGVYQAITATLGATLALTAIKLTKKGGK